MRMSRFIVGGLVGAAAVMYLTRNNKPMMWSSWGQAGESVNRWMGSAKEGMMGLSKVKDIVDEDPQLRHQVDEILNANDQKSDYPTQ